MRVRCCAVSGKGGTTVYGWRRAACPGPVLRSRVNKAWWEACLEIPAETLKGLWNLELAPGGVLYANFYKCGDDTPQPHFISWSPIDLPKPDFHAPQFFGALELL